MKCELISEEATQYDLITNVFINRGFKTKSDIQHYIYQTSPKDEHDEQLLLNIDEGVKMLARAIAEEKRLLLIVDGDCDGYTSSALFINYLYSLFPNYATTHIQYVFHPGKQHGIILEEIADMNYDVLICIDSASNDCAQHEALYNEDKQILILDHHEVDQISDYACIINNQMGDYPNRALSGVGVAYKFCRYFDKVYFGQDNTSQLLDLVALGEIADMMPLNTFENRYLISTGIKNINNPYIAAMVQKNSFSLKGEVTPVGIAFCIAPYVNAVIRSGTAQDKEILFKAMLESEAYNLVPSTKRGEAGKTEMIVTQACRMCGNVKNHQTIDRDAGLETAERLIAEGNLTLNKILCIIYMEENKCKSTLTGLIANQLMDKYKRPVLILRETDRNGEPWYEGSARGYSKSDLTDFRGFLIQQGISEIGGYAQGHSNAFGAGIPVRYFKDFIQKCELALSDITFETKYRVDRIFETPEQCNKEEFTELALLNDCWGQELEEPLFLFKNITITTNVILMSRDKNPTLKITLPNGLDCIKFKSSEEEFENLYTDVGRVVVNLVGQCEKNEWNGHISSQVIIKDYEIVTRNEYYF